MEQGCCEMQQYRGKQQKGKILVGAAQPAAHVRKSGTRGKQNRADHAQAQTNLPGIERPGVLQHRSRELLIL